MGLLDSASVGPRMLTGKVLAGQPVGIDTLAIEHASPPARKTRRKLADLVEPSMSEWFDEFRLRVKCLRQDASIWNLHQGLVSRPLFPLLAGRSPDSGLELLECRYRLGTQVLAQVDHLLLPLLKVPAELRH